VLRHRRRGHAKATLNLPNRLFGRGQESQYRPAIRLGDDFEYRSHPPNILDGAYACQGIYYGLRAMGDSHAGRPQSRRPSTTRLMRTCRRDGPRVYSAAARSHRTSAPNIEVQANRHLLFVDSTPAYRSWQDAYCLARSFFCCSPPAETASRLPASRNLIPRLSRCSRSTTTTAARAGTTTKPH